MDLQVRSFSLRLKVERCLFLIFIPFAIRFFFVNFTNEPKSLTANHQKPKAKSQNYKLIRTR